MPLTGDLAVGLAVGCCLAAGGWGLVAQFPACPCGALAGLLAAGWWWLVAPFPAPLGWVGVGGCRSGAGVCRDMRPQPETRRADHVWVRVGGSRRTLRPHIPPHPLPARPGDHTVTPAPLRGARNCALNHNGPAANARAKPPPPPGARGTARSTTTNPQQTRGPSPHPLRGAGNCATSHERPAPNKPAESPAGGRGELRDQPRAARTQQTGGKPRRGPRGTARPATSGPHPTNQRKAPQGPVGTYSVLTVTLPLMMSSFALSTAATTSVIAWYFGLESEKPTPPVFRSPRCSPESGLPSTTDLVTS
ncbi:hypothetical protein QF026_003400 [Streptomyces aurantiacus]|nr:hypothetical protein [Streptomyces aurantiacus]